MRRSKPKGISRNIILLQYVERVEKEEDPTILPGKDPNPQWILDWRHHGIEILKSVSLLARYKARKECIRYT